MNILSSPHLGPKCNAILKKYNVFFTVVKVLKLAHHCGYPKVKTIRQDYALWKCYFVIAFVLN